VSTDHIVRGGGFADDTSTTELEVDAQLFTGEDSCFTLRLRFVYRMNNPYAVTLEVPCACTDLPPVTRELSRELLWEGTWRPAGLGDVRFWPPSCRCGDGQLSLLLMGVETTALLEVPLSTLRTWLVADSFTMVPAGSESRLIDWDTVLEHLRDGL
jgi:hypothetical protein